MLTEEEAQVRVPFTIGTAVKETAPMLDASQTALIYPESVRQALVGAHSDYFWTSAQFSIQAPDHAKVTEAVKKQLEQDGINSNMTHDIAANRESQRMLVLVVRVFSYGFIILISLIAMANVFNTISTSVMLRRREFAMLRSIGMGRKDFQRMMNYECLIYGCKGLLWGLPAAVGLTYVIYRITAQAMDQAFYIPWYSVAIAVGSVFAVVFATMLYATRVVRRDNTIDALRQENL